MLASLVPVFNSEMVVKAYLLYAQKENLFAHPHLLGSGQLDGAGNIAGVEVLDTISMNSLPKDVDVFVPVNNISIFADISLQYKGPKDRLILLMDTSVKPEKQYFDRLRALHNEGYRLAIRNLPIALFESYRFMLDIFEYIFLDYTKVDINKLSIYFSKLLPNIKLCAENILTQEDFERINRIGGYDFFEGSFYRIPIDKNDTNVSPLKTNCIQLLALINRPDFELTDAADIIAKDPALTIALLNIVNKMTLNSKITSIKQATALLGQRELKHWLNTAVVTALCADSPNEITRLVLIRAKFCENLAPIFNLAMNKEELFLMGLFSLLDYILDKPLNQALETVNVEKLIVDALVHDKGPFYDVINFMRAYEAGDWKEASRLMVLKDIDMDEIYEAYIGSLKWYKDMFM